MATGKANLFYGLLVAAFICRSEDADLVLSPDGSVDTPALAIRKARELRMSGAVVGRPVQIKVCPGRYLLKEPVVLSSDDSGICFQGTGFNDCIFDGGLRLPSFCRGADGVWETTVPDGVAVDQLWVNGVRAQRARSPNRYYYYMREQDYEHPRRAFFAESRDIAPLLDLSKDELSRVTVSVWQSWDMGYSRIGGLDGRTGRVELAETIGWPLFYWNRTCPRYALENFRAALDAPGEWFFDADTRRLYYIPRAEETPDRAVAIVPLALGIVAIRGNRTRGQIVRDVSFKGIGFEYAACRTANGALPARQCAVNVDQAAIVVEGAEDFVLEHCRIAHTTMHGVWMRGGSKRSRMCHCLVEDLGGGGVYLGDVKADLNDRSGNSERLEVFDSIVRHGGRLMNAGVGVWIGMAHDCSVVHNDIYDFMYTGVSSGWTWGYSETITRNIRVMHNRIHHIGQGVLSDLGGFYSLGNHTDGKVCNNWIWEVRGYQDNGSPAWGLYADEGTKGILFADNLVERCRDGAVHQHYGADNVFSNNIFATFNRYAVWRSRNENHLSLRLQNNIFYWNDSAAGAYTGGGGYESLGDIVSDSNLYWCAGGLCPTAFMGRSWDAWRKVGKDVSGRFADPLFVDAPNGDWRLKKASPAFAQGFRPFDWRRAGVIREDRAWTKKASERTWDIPSDAPKAPPYRIERASMDFERFPVGPLRDGMGALLPFSPVLGKAGGLSFTDKDVFSGKRALVFIDSPDNDRPYCPHLVLGCSITGGVAFVRFAFKPMHGAGMAMELRDGSVKGGGYAVGASLFHKGDALWSGNRRVATVTEGEWSSVELRMQMDGNAAGQWAVSVLQPGVKRSESSFGRPLDTRFKSLTWVGFMTYGAGDCVWHLDDLSVFTNQMNTKEVK